MVVDVFIQLSIIERSSIWPVSIRYRNQGRRGNKIRMIQGVLWKRFHRWAHGPLIILYGHEDVRIAISRPLFARSFFSREIERMMMAWVRLPAASRIRILPILLTLPAKSFVYSLFLFWRKRRFSLYFANILLVWILKTNLLIRPQEPRSRGYFEIPSWINFMESFWNYD